MSTPHVKPHGGNGNPAPTDLRNLEKVRGVFAALARFVNARAIYQKNNPGFIRSAQLYEHAFRSYFETEAELLLTVEQYQLVWRGQVVYDIGCSTESIAFLLYKDGIGELSIHSSVGRSELEDLAGILTGALYNPSAQFDTATAFWQAEFPNIFYRVLDEQTDGAGGEGEGSGNAQREQSLRASDHQDLDSEQPESPPVQRSDASLGTLGWHLTSLLERDHPGLSPVEKETRFQAMLAEHLTLDPDEVVSWMDVPRAGAEGDELITFLQLMLEFTGAQCAPPVARDINDTIERLVHYVRDEGHIPTLTATLELVGNLDGSKLDTSFSAVPDRVEAELMESAYLMSLVQGFRGNNSAQDLLRYLVFVGENAVAPLCELLARSTDIGIHEKGCDVLCGLAADRLDTIIDQFDVENSYLAEDAVRLLARLAPPTIAPVIHRMLASKDPVIRQCPIEYLIQLGTDDAARLVCDLLKDADASVRTRAFASIGEFTNPSIVQEVTSLCFADETTTRSNDEQEIMFRALGRSAGINALPHLRHTVEAKRFLPGSRSRNRREKLLALTALRYIPGDDARHMVEKLSTDSDQLVRAKAQHVLKRHQGMGSDVYTRDFDASEEP